MMKHFHNVSSPNCSWEDDWIETGNGSVWISQKAIKKHGDITCQLSYIGRIGDFETKYYKVVQIKGNEKPHVLTDDYFRTTCASKNGAKYINVHAGVALKTTNHITIERNGSALDVLFLGFDSISHMTFIRKLPKTLDYFTNELNGLVLNGYNIVGDGTPQAFFPILTGKTEQELPSALKRAKEKRFIDSFPWIWNEYRQRGYVTSFCEDFPNAGMFTYRLMGFKDKPTDHFMRPFYLEVHKMENENPISNLIDMTFWTARDKLCIGSKRKSEVFMNYVKQLYAVHRSKPKFTIGFLGDMSHDDQNKVETADVDLVNLLKHLQLSGNLNNTILILMSDHGARYKEVRAELQGKYEERMPFFGFAFPSWFKHKYPQEYYNFRTNTERLSTPFDIHSTLLKILSLDDIKSVDQSERGISLFTEIPKSRTCHEAGIPIHWCACLNWYTASVSDDRVKSAAEFVTNKINLHIESEKACAKLSLHNVTRALKFLPDSSLVKFLRAADVNGVHPDMSDNTYVDKVMYQVWLYTFPNKAHYEATVIYNIKSGIYWGSIDEVSRINEYGHDADCSLKGSLDIRKFCFCKKGSDKEK
ncbi:hypothetical protein FSP39_024527 [Pinctada imbricata]|uniref:Uncharacterized protein n=1 Tax=Pinctada imbricata TaxID=66713 RepID=A0AA88YA66_PINIB|nr:hypothetical protein FSP39_024527 [Pinctada imbricata]